MQNIETFALGPGPWLWPFLIGLAIFLAVINGAYVVEALWKRKRAEMRGTIASARQTADPEAVDHGNDRPDSHRRAA